MSDNRPDFSQRTPPYQGGDSVTDWNGNEIPQKYRAGDTNSPFARFGVSQPGTFTVKNGTKEIPTLNIRERLTAKSPQVGGSEIKPKEDHERQEIEDLGRAAKGAGFSLVTNPDGSVSLEEPDDDYFESVKALQITISGLLSERRALLGKDPNITRNTALEILTTELEKIEEEKGLTVASIVEKIQAFEKLLRKEEARIVQEEQEKIQKAQEEQKAEQEKLLEQQKRLISLVPHIARFTALSGRAANLLGSKNTATPPQRQGEITTLLSDLDWLQNDPLSKTDPEDMVKGHLDELQTIIIQEEQNVWDAEEREREVARLAAEDEKRLIVMDGVVQFSTLGELTGEISSVLTKIKDQERKDALEASLTNAKEKSRLFSTTQDAISLDTFILAVEECERLLEQEKTAIEAERLALEKAPPLDVWSGWPKFISYRDIKANPKQGIKAEQVWEITPEGQHTRPLRYRETWTLLKTEFDTVFRWYLSFLNDGETVRKIAECKNLITSKNEIIQALASENTELAGSLIAKFRVECETTKKAWDEMVQREAETKAKEKTEEMELKSYTDRFNASVKGLEEQKQKRDLLLREITSTLEREMIVRHFNVLQEQKQKVEEALRVKNREVTQKELGEFIAKIRVVSDILTEIENTRNRIYGGKVMRSVTTPGAKVLRKGFKDDPKKVTTMEEWQVEQATKVAQKNQEDSAARTADQELLKRRHEEMLEENKDAYIDMYAHKEVVTDDPHTQAAAETLETHKQNLLIEKQLNMDREQAIKFQIINHIYQKIDDNHEQHTRLKTELSELNDLINQNGPQEEVPLETIRRIAEINQEIQAIKDEQAVLWHIVKEEDYDMIANSAIDQFNEINYILEQNNADLEALATIPQEELSRRARTLASATRSKLRETQRYSPSSDPTVTNIGVTKADQPKGLFAKLAQILGKRPMDYQSANADDRRRFDSEKLLTDEEVDAQRKKIITLSPNTVPKHTSGMVSDLPDDEIHSRAILNGRTPYRFQPHAIVHTQEETQSEEQAPAAHVEHAPAGPSQQRRLEKNQRVQTLLDRLIANRGMQWAGLILAAAATAGVLYSARNNAKDPQRIEAREPKTFGEAVKWRSFIESEFDKGFVQDIIQNGGGKFELFLRKYAGTYTFSRSNPSDLAKIAELNCYDAITTEIPTYAGLSVDQRKEVCDIIKKLHVIIELTKAPKQALSGKVPDFDGFTPSTVDQNITLYELFERARAAIEEADRREK